VEPVVLSFAFQKSTVFEKTPKHRETVAEGNVFESWLEAITWERVDNGWPGYDESPYTYH
jgi:hypothetical protein